MDRHTAFIEQVERYCAANDISPDSLCRRATGDPRKWTRLKARIQRTHEDMARITACMAGSDATGEAS